MSQERNSGNARTWLITGASSGLGYALAKYVLEQGDRVAMGSRTLDNMIDLAERHPGRALALVLDVTNAEQRAAAVQQTEARLGSIDVLVNNAAYFCCRGGIRHQVLCCVVLCCAVSCRVVLLCCSHSTITHLGSEHACLLVLLRELIQHARRDGSGVGTQQVGAGLVFGPVVAPADGTTATALVHFLRLFSQKYTAHAQ